MKFANYFIIIDLFLSLSQGCKKWNNFKIFFKSKLAKAHFAYAQIKSLKNKGLLKDADEIEDFKDIFGRA